MTDTSATTFTIRDLSGRYDLHAFGCSAATDDTFTWKGADAVDAAARFAAENDGCWIAKAHGCLGLSKAAKAEIAAIAARSDI